MLHGTGRFTYMKSINLNHWCIGLIFHTWSIWETYISITKLCKSMNYCSSVCVRSIHIPCLYIYIWCVSLFTAMVNTSRGRRRYDGPHKRNTWPDSDGSHPPWNGPSKLGETSTGNPNALHSHIPIQQDSNATMWIKHTCILASWSNIDVLRIFLRIQTPPDFSWFFGFQPHPKRIRMDRCNGPNLDTKTERELMAS